MRVEIFILVAFNLLKYCKQSESVCRDILPLKGELYDSLFVATEIVLPISDPLIEVPPPQNITGSKCTYQSARGTYYIRGNSCDELPVNSSITDTDVYIHRTVISSLVTGVFSSYTGLKSLHIKENSRLKIIKRRAFANLDLLKNLTITSNPSLNVFEAGCFAGLYNLEHMSLLGNGIKSIGQISAALIPLDLPRLVYIDLRENVIRQVGESDFEPMAGAPLKALILSSTHTEYIHHEAFDPLVNLEKVIFTLNKINSTVAGRLIGHLATVNTKLDRVSFAANPLYYDVSRLLNAVASSSISYFDISNNYFLEMKGGFFPYMPNLEILDISNVMINDLSNDVVNAVLMPNLSTLILSKNNLRELSPDLALPELTELDLSFINYNNLAWNINFNIDENAFKNLPKLKWVTFTSTRLVSIRNDTFSTAPNLEYLSLRDTSLVSIDDNAFLFNDKLKYLDLSRNDFPIFRSLSNRIFTGLKSLQALDLSYTHISSFSENDFFRHLRSLQFLSLRMNSLHTIDSSLFVNLPCLTVVDLRYNTMVSWNHRVFTGNRFIKNVFLDYNHLTIISGEMVRDFSSADRVRLKGNSITCDCQLVDNILENSQSDGNEESFFRLPFNDSSDSCSNMPHHSIVNYLEEKAYSYECQRSKWPISVAIALIISLLFAVVSCFVYRNYRLSIEFAYLTIKERMGLIKFRGRNVCLGNLDGSEKDAFVSYSCEDESFVEKMVFILENEGFDLLLYKRDFNAGDIIPDRILESIESSRKTILILSESFAKSQWCIWEMLMAQHRSIALQDSKKDPYLVLIKKSDIQESVMTPTLKHLLKTRVYLEWHESPFRQKIFWHQLKMVLTTSKREKNLKEVPT